MMGLISDLNFVINVHHPRLVHEPCEPLLGERRVPRRVDMCGIRDGLDEGAVGVVPRPGIGFVRVKCALICVRIMEIVTTRMRYLISLVGLPG